MNIDYGRYKRFLLKNRYKFESKLIIRNFKYQTSRTNTHAQKITNKNIKKEMI